MRLQPGVSPYVARANSLLFNNACFCMVAMAMMSVTWANDPEIEANFLKREVNPSLNVIQHKCELSPGRPEALTFSNGQRSAHDSSVLDYDEIIRLSTVHAQQRAFELHQQLTGIQGNYITNASSFFTETAKVLVAPDVSQGSLSVGTDCSGMEAPLQALANLNVEHHQPFACDNDPLVLKTIVANHSPGVLYKDIEGRDNTKVPYVDLYVAGFPCQPFSTAGKQQGFEDAKGRGKIFFDVVDYITIQRPKIFILENVEGLTIMDKGKHLKYIMKILRAIGSDANTDVRGATPGGAYEIHDQVLNTYDHGVPQSRPRWYCVGFRKDALVQPGGSNFEFPTAIPCPSIEQFLDPSPPLCPGQPAKSTTPFYPTGFTVQRNIKKAI